MCWPLELELELELELGLDWTVLNWVYQPCVFLLFFIFLPWATGLVMAEFIRMAGGFLVLDYKIIDRMTTQKLVPPII
jgi:hypothetical protein